MNLHTITAAALVAATAIGASTGIAAAKSYTAFLNDDQTVPSFTSSATGTATLFVDEADETLDFSLSVTGISLDDLWDTLVAAPVGPLHLHNNVVGATGPIVIPFAFGPTYTNTADGFELTVMDYAFADAIALSGAAVTFAEFVAGLDAEAYYANIHTDFANPGEIRGQLSAVPVPAVGLMLLGAMGGLAALRRRAA